MNTEAAKHPEAVTATVELSGPDWQLQAKMTVPTGPTRLIQLLPLVQSLTNTIVDSAAEASEKQGERISCKKGCGACCRQLVPIAEVEARHIRDLVNELPEPRRSQVRARFAEARRRLENAGLLGKLLDRAHWTEGEGRAFGQEYFSQGIPCPFLEEESCSIHPDRPIACREYLVTSPAENCARPTAETVHPLRMPLKVWTAVARFDKAPAMARFIRWVPLILAPEWADTHLDDTPPRPGPELLRELFAHLTRKAEPHAPVQPFDRLDTAKPGPPSDSNARRVGN